MRICAAPTGEPHKLCLFPLVEGHGCKLAVDDSAANGNSPSAVFIGIGGNECHCIIAADSGCGAARGDDADFFTVAENIRLGAGNALSDELQTDAFAGLGLEQSFFADEIGLVEFDCKAEAALNGVDVRTHFMTVKGHGSFKTERVACAEAAGQHVNAFARFKQSLKQANGIFRRTVKLKAS